MIICVCQVSAGSMFFCWGLQINVKVVQYHAAHQNRSIKKERGLNVVNGMFVHFIINL